MTDILSILKQKRKEIAFREGKEIFMIFPNATLEMTAKLKPENKTELSEIKGWGKKKIEKYGDEILSLIKNNETESERKNILAEREGESLKNHYSVGEFLEFINRILSAAGSVRVRGEILKADIHSGNAYGTLKDSERDDCVLDFFIGRWDLPRMEHLLEAGFEVELFGMPGVYKNGRFRVVVKNIEPVGEGALKKAFEALKKKLEEKGYFDPDRKRSVPDFVKTIGLITSETGDAINDFRKNIGGHGFHIFLYDVRVEGDYAENSIAGAFRWLNANRPDLDVLVLIRGGGGLESLKAFNSERVAEAIAASRIPVVTGVGHEADETIADFVADKRSSTPTAAAIFLKRGREALISGVENNLHKLTSSFGILSSVSLANIARTSSCLVNTMERVLDQERARVVRFGGQIERGLRGVFEVFRKAESLFNRQIYNYSGIISGKNSSLEKTREFIAQNIMLLAERLNSRIASAEKNLASLNPEAVLERGYSIVFKDKTAVKKAEDLLPGDLVSMIFHKGRAYSEVKLVEKE